METQRSGGVKFWTMIVLFTVLGSATLGAYLMAAPANVNRFYPGGMSLASGGEGFSIGADTVLSRSAANVWSLGAGDSLVGATWVNSTNVSASSLYIKGYYPGSSPSFTVGVNGASYWSRNEANGDITTSANCSDIIIDCLNQGGVTLLKPGTYSWVDDTSIWADNWSLVGSGYNTTIFISGCNNFFYNCTNFMIKDIKVLGDGTGAFFLFRDDCEDALLDHVYGTNMTGHIFDMTSLHDAMFTNCIAEAGTDDGFAFATTGCYNITAIGCIGRNQVGGGSSNGFEIDDGAHEITISGCLAYNNVGNNGIDIHSHAASPPCYAITIANNVMLGDNIALSAIDPADTTTYPFDISINGNIVKGGTIDVDDAYRVSIANNVISNSTLNGISIKEYCSQVSVNGNIISYPGQYGIQANGANINIIGNTIKYQIGDTCIRVRDGTHADNIIIANNNIVPRAAGNNGIQISIGQVTASDNNMGSSRILVNGGTGILIEGNSFDGGYILVTYGTKIAIIGNILNNPSSDGISTSIAQTRIQDNFVFGITGGGINGITVSGNYCVVDGNEVDTTANGHGINWSGGTNVHVTNNILRSIAGGGKYGIYTTQTTGEVIGNVGTISLGSPFTGMIRDNVNYVTENSGTSSIASGSTSIAFAHGLSTTPVASWFTITFTENPTNLVSSHWLTCNATHTILNVNTDPGASNLDFGWKAIKP